MAGVFDGEYTLPERKPGGCAQLQREAGQVAPGRMRAHLHRLDAQLEAVLGGLCGEPLSDKGGEVFCGDLIERCAHAGTVTEPL